MLLFSFRLEISYTNIIFFSKSWHTKTFGSHTQETLVKVQDNVVTVPPTLVWSENTVWTCAVNVSEKRLLTLDSTNTDKCVWTYWRGVERLASNWINLFKHHNGEDLFIFRMELFLMYSLIKFLKMIKILISSVVLKMCFEISIMMQCRDNCSNERAKWRFANYWMCFEMQSNSI